MTKVAGNGQGAADGAALAQAQFNNPSHVVVDASGNLLVAGYAGQNVRRIAPNGCTSRQLPSPLFWCRGGL